MKITQIDVIKVRVPYHEGIYELMTRRNLYQIDHVYKVHTDIGLVGIGDGAFQADDVVQRYIGRNPFEFMKRLGTNPPSAGFLRHHG